MHDVHAEIEKLERTVDAAQSVLGQAERVLTVADEAHERSHRLVTRVAFVLAVGAAVIVALATLRRRSP
jgi:hypothetical protein